MHCGANIIAQEIYQTSSLKFNWCVDEIITLPQNSIGLSKESFTSPKSHLLYEILHTYDTLTIRCHIRQYNYLQQDNNYC